MKLASKEVANRREVFRGCWSAGFPLSIEAVLWFLDAHLRHRDQSNVGVVGSQCLKVGIIRVSDWPLHVGLARADPDFADKYIFKNFGFVSFDDQIMGATGR